MATTAGRIRVDWFRVIADLEARSYKPNRIAAVIGWSRGTVVGWRNYEAEPNHGAGEALIALWVQVCGPFLPEDKRADPRAAVPRRVDDFLSAARALAPDRKKSGFQHAG